MKSPCALEIQVQIGIQGGCEQGMLTRGGSGDMIICLAWKRFADNLKMCNMLHIYLLFEDQWLMQC